MIELLVGYLLGVAVAGGQGWAGAEQQLVGVVGALVAYFGSCLFWPYRACPLRALCRKRRQTAQGPGGNYRRRAVCPVCLNSDYVRLGARVMRRG